MTMTWVKAPGYEGFAQVVLQPYLYRQPATCTYKHLLTTNWIKLNHVYLTVSIGILKLWHMLKYCITMQSNFSCRENVSFSIETISNVPQSNNCATSMGIVRGIARTQSPANKNCTPELTTFGLIAGVSQPECNGKPHPGRTTFVIMVSPVPGKYAGDSDSREFTSLDWGLDGTSGMYGIEE